MRIANRLLAFVVALALAATGVIVILEVVAARSNAAPLVIHWHSILRWGQRNTWKATSVELACAITAAVGLVLLVPQLIPRRLQRLTIDAGEDTDAALSRQGVATAMRGAVTDVEGVVGARVKVGRRRIRVNAYAIAAEPENADELEPRVEEVARQHLAALRLHPERRLRVAVSTRRAGGQ